MHLRATLNGSSFNVNENTCEKFVILGMCGAQYTQYTQWHWNKGILLTLDKDKKKNNNQRIQNPVSSGYCIFVKTNSHHQPADLVFIEVDENAFEVENIQIDNNSNNNNNDNVNHCSSDFWMEICVWICWVNWLNEIKINWQQLNYNFPKTR